MGAEQRIKGQDVSLLLVVKGQVVSALTDVRSFEMAAQLEILREGYLGETTDRRDEVYRGVRGRMEVHFESADVFKLVRAVIDRARRREPGTKINAKATLQFPNGDRPIVLVKDIYFGELPMNFPGRTEYGTVALEWEAADFQVIS